MHKKCINPARSPSLLLGKPYNQTSWILYLLCISHIPAAHIAGRFSAEWPNNQPKQRHNPCNLQTKISCISQFHAPLRIRIFQVFRNTPWFLASSHGLAINVNHDAVISMGTLRRLVRKESDFRSPLHRSVSFFHLFTDVRILGYQNQAGG